MATSSRTTALHLALAVAGVEARDEVAVTALSFIATADAPYVGARPVFCDVDAVAGNVAEASVEAALTPRTRAVIVVDQGGVPVDLDEIRGVCAPRGIVVEDAACGAGSTDDGRGLRAVADPAHGTGNLQFYWVEVGDSYGCDREGLLVRLAQAGISARRGIMAAHRQPAYAQVGAHLPVTDRLTDNTLILPLFHQMSESEQARVVDVLRAAR